MAFRIVIKDDTIVEFEVVGDDYFPIRDNEKVLRNNLMPDDFGTNFHTYNYKEGMLVRKDDVEIGDRIIKEVDDSFPQALEVICNTPPKE